MFQVKMNKILLIIFLNILVAVLGKEYERLPKMVIIDLDYTCWPYWIDNFLIPPYTRNKKGQLIDYHERVILPYPDIPKILKYLTKLKVKIAVASRTGQIRGAISLLEKLGWSKYISYRQIHPGRKTDHFKKISKDSGIKFEDMLLFDDEQPNLNDGRELGIISILVPKGLDLKILKDGLLLYSDTKTGKRVESMTRKPKRTIAKRRTKKTKKTKKD